MIGDRRLSAAGRSRSAVDPGVAGPSVERASRDTPRRPQRNRTLAVSMTSFNTGTVTASPRSSSQRPRGTSGGRRGERGLAGAAPRGAFPSRDDLRGSRLRETSRVPPAGASAGRSASRGGADTPLTATAIHGFAPHLATLARRIRNRNQTAGNRAASSHRSCRVAPLYRKNDRRHRH